jgi:hypothetical protein
MVKRKRLGRSKRLTHKDRMLKLKDPYGDYDGDGVNNMKDCNPTNPEEHFKLLDVLNDENNSFAGKLGERAGKFVHEVLHLETPEETERKQNLKRARMLTEMHPDENVILKVELEDEPEQNVGRNFLVRADDFINFDEVEAEDVDTGKVFTIRRDNVKKVIGAMSMSAIPEMPPSATTLGSAMRMSTDKPLPVDIGAEQEKKEVA